MMHILICEDDLGQRSYIESVVQKTITTESVKMKLILSSGNPTEVLAYLETHQDQRGLYFLDVDFQHHEIDGFKLAVKIRETDPSAKIVFITAHSELAHLTFQHKLSAMDYIVKDSPEDIEAQVIECMLVACERYLKEKSALIKNFKIDANGEIWSIPHDDVLFFETNSKVRNKIILHMKDSKLGFRGVLGEIEQQIPELYRCHKSYLLNLNQIAYVDKITREAVMKNGERVHIAEKKIAELKRMIDMR